MKNFNAANLLSVTIVGTSSAGVACLWLLDASIKSLILLVFGAVVCYVLSRASAATRHWIWATTLIGLIIMPAATLLLPQWRILPSWLAIESRFAEVTPIHNSHSVEIPFGPIDSNIAVLPTNTIEVAQPAAAIATELAMTAAEPTRASNWPVAIRINANLLLMVWSAGVLLLLAPIVLAFVRLKCLEQKSTQHGTLDPHLHQRIAKAAKELDVKLPRIIVGPAGAMPMVWSFGSNRLLLPKDCDGWSMARWNAILSHELIHLRRRDPMLFTLGMVARALNWFNPLAWYALARLRVECERACDDYVLGLGVDASDYAVQLLEFSTGMRPARGTSSLAFAMATRPNIEQRIASVLDEKRNRCGVTLRRAIALLVLVSCGAALLSTLRATVAKEKPTPQDKDKVEIKYPYCVIEVDSLEQRSLAEAIEAFNLESQQSPTGVTQPPITEQETLTAIAEALKQPNVSEPNQRVLREIESTKVLPAKAYFRRFTRFDDEQQMHGVWWVRLCIESDAPPMFSVAVRTRHLYSRPYSQLEREQNFQQARSVGFALVGLMDIDGDKQDDTAKLKSMILAAGGSIEAIMNTNLEVQGQVTSRTQFIIAGADTIVSDKLPIESNAQVQKYSEFIKDARLLGVTEMPLERLMQYLEAAKDVETGSGLVNRKVSYFETLPQIQQPEELPKAAVDNLIAKFQTAIGEKNARGLRALFDWQDTGLNNFAKSELRMLMNATIHSIKVEPVRLSGNLLHWSGFRAYRPNLPVVAYLEIEFSGRTPLANPGNMRKKISLELGKVGEDFQLVNYVADELKLPAGEARYSMRGQNERLANGIYQVTSLISNPGDLISAHLANEEVWHRDFERKHVAKQEDPNVKVNHTRAVRKDIALFSIDVKEFAEVLKRFFGDRIIVTGLEVPEPTEQQLAAALQAGGKPRESEPTVAVVASVQTNSIVAFAMPEDMEKIEGLISRLEEQAVAVVGDKIIRARDLAQVGKNTGQGYFRVSPPYFLRPDELNVDELSADDIVAVVGTEKVTAGDMMWFVDPILEKNRANLSAAQEKQLRGKLIRECLPQYLNIKVLCGEFFVDMAGKKTSKEAEEMQAKVRLKAAQIFHDKQVPTLLKRFAVSDVAALEKVLKERSTSLATLQKQFTERVLASEFERKYVPDRLEFSQEELMAYYKAHEKEWLEGEPAKAKSFEDVKSEIRKKLNEEKRRVLLDALYAKVLSHTNIWTLWPADIPNSRPLSEFVVVMKPEALAFEFERPFNQIGSNQTQAWRFFMGATRPHTEYREVQVVGSPTWKVQVVDSATGKPLP